MTVREIIENYLKENGYDGLCSDECGCQIGDLCPCESYMFNCVPGYLHKCDENCDHEFAYITDWHISTEKSKESKS
jgi:hypothetical protein